METGSTCVTAALDDRQTSTTNKRPQIRVPGRVVSLVEKSSNVNKVAMAADASPYGEASNGVCCTVCERHEHGAMFNIFKCFCLAQRLFGAAKLFEFRRFHLKSSYMCEECVERLEVIEELELLKKEFVRNFLGRCKVENLSAGIGRPIHNKAPPATTGHKLGVVSEDEMNSVICTPTRAQEPEVMFIGRLKRQLALMPESDGDKNELEINKKWKVDVLSSPNELGGMTHLNIGSLPTIRKLFTSHGMRRYWLLPPKSPDLIPMRTRKRRYAELVQYLKQQTASNALLASAQSTHFAVAKRLKTLPATEQFSDQASISQELTSEDSRKNDATKDYVTGTPPEGETEPASPSDTAELHIASSDDESVVIIDDDEDEIEHLDVDPLFNLEENSLIENVVESFLYVDAAEIQRMANRNANILEQMFESEPPPPPSIAPAKVNYVGRPAAKTKRVAPMIRMIAPKSASAGSTSTSVATTTTTTTMSVSSASKAVGSNSTIKGSPIMMTFTSVGGGSNVTDVITTANAPRQLTFLANSNQSLMLVRGVNVGALSASGALAYVTPSLISLPIQSISTKDPSTPPVVPT